MTAQTNEVMTLNNYGQPITYFGIAYTLTKEDNDRLDSIDKAIQDCLKDAIYFAPDGSRHITIMNITAVIDGYKDQDTVQFFEDTAQLYKDRLKAIASGISSFEVTLNRVQVGSSAVILRGKDNGQISTIRDALIDLPRLGGRVIDAGFIHSSQARYRKQITIGAVREQLENIKANVPITVDRIGLVRADVNFSKPHTVLEEFELLKAR